MSYESARKLVQGFFSDNFSYLSSSNISWDNVEFSPPNKESWIRLSYRNINSSYVSLGPTRKVRRNCFLIIQVFVPENKETLEMTRIIDSVVSIFETTRLNGFTFRSPDVVEVGVVESWFQTNISVPFHYDELRTIN